jgi:formate-dependent nitrite reductase membrane component NrfD
MEHVQTPHWPFLIDVYFFLGGLAGGAFVIATIANLLDSRRYRDVVRAGYYLALVALLPCPIILIVDLGVPARFLNMLGRFNPSSPMSMGAWALLGFSVMAGLAALLTLLEDMRRRDYGAVKVAIGVVGGFFAFFLAAYPGVLLGATAHPFWTNGHALGALFLAVGASTGAAAIALIIAATRRTADLLARLNTVIVMALAVQALSTLIFLWSVAGSGSPGAARALGMLLGGNYATLFWGGAVVVGLVAPLLMGLIGMRRASVAVTALASLFVLVGGFVVKTVIMMAGQV